MTRACPSRQLRAIVLPLPRSLLCRADSRPVSMLIRSFLKPVRPEELRPVAWDIVLQSLTRAPFEPLRASDERFLAQKMLFLLALASAKRVDELHSLSHRISHSRDWGEVSFTFVAGFVAKMQDPSSSSPRFEGFTVPALPNASTRLVCPMQAVRCYLDRIAAHCPRCERLFVTAGRSTKEVLKNTVSFWLRKTISRAYQLSGRSVPDPPPRRTSLSPRCMAQAHHLHTSLPEGPCA